MLFGKMSNTYTSVRFEFYYTISKSAAPGQHDKECVELKEKINRGGKNSLRDDPRF